MCAMASSSSLASCVVIVCLVFGFLSFFLSYPFSSQGDRYLVIERLLFFFTTQIQSQQGSTMVTKKADQITGAWKLSIVIREHIMGSTIF